MLNFFLISLIIISTTQNINSYGKLSNLRKCADKHCKEKISVGRTTQHYMGIVKGVLKFKIDEVATVFSKEAGTNLDYWGVQIGDRRGYVPKKFIQEEKIFVNNANLKYIVTTHTSGTQENESKAQLNTKTHSNDGRKPVISKGNIDGKAGLNSEGKIDVNIEEEVILNTGTKVKISSNTEYGAGLNTEGETDLNAEIETYSNIEGNVDSNAESVKSQTTESNPVLNSESKIAVSTESKRSLTAESETTADAEDGITEDPAELNVDGVHEETPSASPVLLNGGDVEFETMKNLVNANVPPKTVVDAVHKQVPGKSDAPIEAKVGNPEENLIVDDPNHNNEGTIETNNDVQGEQIDNEDEGNGNEGEENGSEFVVKFEEQEEREVIKDFVPPTEEDGGQSNLPPKQLSVGREMTDSVLNTHTQFVQDTVSPTSAPETDTTSTTSDEPLVNPTPSGNYEVVDGTTIMLEESDLLPASNDGQISNRLPLKTSQGPRQGARMAHPTPYAKLENTPITEAPIVQKLQVKQDVKPAPGNVAPAEPLVPDNTEHRKEHSFEATLNEASGPADSALLPNAGEVVSEGEASAAGQLESPSVGSESTDLNAVGKDSEFSTPKPNTVLQAAENAGDMLTMPKDTSLEVPPQQQEEEPAATVEAPPQPQQQQHPAATVEAPQQPVANVEALSQTLQDTVDPTPESKDMPVLEQLEDTDAPQTQEESSGFFSSLFTRITGIATEEEKKEIPEQEIKVTPEQEIKETPKGEIKETPKGEIEEAPKEEIKEVAAEETEPTFDERSIKEISTASKPTSIDKKDSSTVDQPVGNTQPIPVVNESSVDDMIANLSFIDPDVSRRSPDDGDPASPVYFDSHHAPVQEEPRPEDPPSQNDSTPQQLHHDFFLGKGNHVNFL